MDEHWSAISEEFLVVIETQPLFLFIVYREFNEISFKLLPDDIFPSPD